MRKFKFVSGQVMAVTASLLLVAACGGGGGDDLVDELTGDTTTTTEATTTTTTSSVGSTTTTTIVAASASLNNYGRGLCASDNGANEVVGLDPCFANVASHNWRVIGYGENKVAFQNLATERCISNANLAAAPEGGNAVTVACDGSPATIFTQAPSTAVAEGFTLTNDVSTQCMEIDSVNGAQSGGRVTQWTCGSNLPHQTWRMTVNP